MLSFISRKVKTERRGKKKRFYCKRGESQKKNFLDFIFLKY